MRRSFTLLFFVLAFGVSGQNNQPSNLPQNTADRLLGDNNRLSIGGYGQIDYNQILDGAQFNNGKLDVHRFVLMFGYKFSDNTKVITEIELEHVSEVYVEQAFLQHRFNDFINLRGGLMLVPMGIVNEYHEPTTFNGVERPNVDKYIVPTTWREIGFGFTGRIDPIYLKYQAYLFNGFNGYDDAATFSGKNGYRKGRQKGAESYISAPNFSAKLDFYGIPKLKLGLAYYGGKSQSTLFNGVDKSNEFLVSQADSSVIGINMFGLDAIYNIKGIQLRGQFIYSLNSNTEAYNHFGNTDLGSAMAGYYAEVGYNLFQGTKIKSQLIPFLRYERYNTQLDVVDDNLMNKSNDRTEITAGLGWKITPGAILKADYQHVTNGLSSNPTHVLNMGVGVWF